jgi:hypothetical protein
MPYGLATAGDVLTAANVNLLPRGYIGVSSTTTATNSGVSGSLGDVGPTITFTALANRYYRISVLVSRASTAVDNAAVVVLATGAGVTLSTIATTTILSTAGVQVSGYYVGTFAAGSQTVKLRASANTATAISFQNASSPSYMIVEDIGGV